MCEAVVERQNYKCTPVLVDMYECRCLLYVGGVVAVCEYHALWIGCCTAGICNCRYIVVYKRLTHCQELLHGVFCKELVTHGKNLIGMYFAILKFTGIAEDDYFLHLLQLLLYRAYLLQLIVRYEQILHVAVVQSEIKVVTLLELYRERNIYRTGIEHCKVTNNPHVAAFAQQGHIITFLDSQSLEACAQTVYLFFNLSISCWFKSLFLVCFFEEEGIVRIQLHRLLKKIH